MGKGDIKTKKGKIFAGSYGVSRPRNVETTMPAPKKKATKKAAPAAKKAAPKKAAPKKAAAKKTTKKEEESK